MSSLKEKTLPEFFPWLENYMQQYTAWAQDTQPSANDNNESNSEAKEKVRYAPVFFPIICPACSHPGYMLYPLLPAYPVGYPGISQDGRLIVNPCFGQPVPPQPAGNNAFILFLIFILILFGTRKEQILAALRKIFQKG